MKGPQGLCDAMEKQSLVCHYEAYSKGNRRPVRYASERRGKETVLMKSIALLDENDCLFAVRSDHD